MYTMIGFSAICCLIFSTVSILIPKYDDIDSMLAIVRQLSTEQNPTVCKVMACN
ncbi:hypothetical protein GCM10009124_20390 [Shewanella xiamenensis]|nr:hypothetical protein NUITMVS1_16520 [Shewanella xiamenensis]BDQ65751.1 hypothetical protein NUITMVS2_15630 [Shewanella xiamenensis]GGM92200.1 hypothetical protein GCM10009124_20390 [Shewanella xiamenensis]GLD78645.1 hypothetical protein NUITMVS3_30770 [Shewanella xiamenensis]